MGLAALKGYEVANPLAMDLWEEGSFFYSIQSSRLVSSPSLSSPLLFFFSPPPPPRSQQTNLLPFPPLLLLPVYPPSPTSPLHIALTDTLSTPIFFSTAFSLSRAQAWKGLRQDSGDPLLYLQRTYRVYKELGVDMKQKVVVFSDGLDLEAVRRIEEEGKRLDLELEEEGGGGGVKRSYGVGTWLTNDFEKRVGEGKSKALNIVSFWGIGREHDLVVLNSRDNAKTDFSFSLLLFRVQVIKLSKIDGKDCIKISVSPRSHLTTTPLSLSPSLLFPLTHPTSLPSHSFSLITQDEISKVRLPSAPFPLLSFSTQSRSLNSPLPSPFFRRLPPEHRGCRYRSRRQGASRFDQRERERRQEVKNLRPTTTTTTTRRDETVTGGRNLALL